MLLGDQERIYILFVRQNIFINFIKNVYYIIFLKTLIIFSVPFFHTTLTRVPFICHSKPKPEGFIRGK